MKKISVSVIAILVFALTSWAQAAIRTVGEEPVPPPPSAKYTVVPSHEADAVEGLKRLEKYLKGDKKTDGAFKELGKKVDDVGQKIEAGNETLNEINAWIGGEKGKRNGLYHYVVNIDKNVGELKDALKANLQAQQTTKSDVEELKSSRNFAIIVAIVIILLIGGGGYYTYRRYHP